MASPRQPLHHRTRLHALCRANLQRRRGGGVPPAAAPFFRRSAAPAGVPVPISPVVAGVLNQTKPLSCNQPPAARAEVRPLPPSLPPHPETEGRGHSLDGWLGSLGAWQYPGQPLSAPPAYGPAAREFEGPGCVEDSPNRCSSRQPLGSISVIV